VAHNCHGKRINLTAKRETSRQKEKPHGKKEKTRGKKKTLTAKRNTSRQKGKDSWQKEKSHGKKEKTRGKENINITAKEKDSRQKE